MTKEEILEKSRTENASGDEREMQIQRDAGSWAYIIGLFLALLVRVINSHFDGPTSTDTAASLIWIGMSAANSIRMAKQTCSRFYIITSVLLSLFTVFTFATFVYCVSHGI